MITNKFLKIITKKLYIPQVKLILDGSLKSQRVIQKQEVYPDFHIFSGTAFQLPF